MAIDDELETAARMARGVLQRLTGEQIEPVSYEVELHDLGGDHQDWRLRRLHLSEGLSQCYEATIDLLNTNATVDSDELLGQKLTLHVTRGSSVERLVHGVIHRVDYIGITAGNLMVRVYVVPAFRLLSHRVDSRIFQDQSVPEILQTVIEAGLGAFDRELEMRGGLVPEERDDNYPKRDYCVQYEESDLDFVMRLMEEEGITYFFEHDPEEGDRKKELLVLVDQVGDNPNAGCPETDIIDPDGAKEVPIIPDRPDTADTESIQHFDWCLPKQTLKVHSRGFNWKAFDPEAQPEGTAEIGDGSGAAGWEPELYVFGERRKIVDEAGDDDFNGTGIEEFADSAVRRLELFQRQTQLGKGRSNVINLSPGHWFKLREHAHDRVNEIQEFLVTRVIHTADCPDVERQSTDAGSSMRARYENTFEVIPRSTKFRPAITTPKPRIYGPQTATVRGSGNEEIHTDQHGRIKVRFHWDRISAQDDTASCWVRVAQSWAGARWGSLFIPRVGMEVVVEFLHGNPDCPLVTGCVYNNANPPPYDLPDEKTKSTIKTESSPGGGGFNELRFEDAKGSEEVFLHAQKNLNEVIKNDMSTSVGNDQSLSVGNDRTKNITGNEVVTINKDRKTTIDGSDSIHIKGSFNLVIDGSSCKGEAEDPEELGTGMTIIGQYNVSVSEKYVLGVGPVCPPSAADVKLVMDTETALLQTPKEIKLRVGSSEITLAPSKITIKSPHIELLSEACSKLELTGNAELVSPGKVTVRKDGGAKVELTADAEVTAADATVAATGTAKLKGDTSAEVEGGPVTIAGDTVDVTGSSGNVTVTGALVKLNC